MVRRLFVDLESTGDGSNLYHDIVELSCRYYENEKLISTYNASYGYHPAYVYNANTNKGKAELNSKNGCGTSDEDFATWELWLEEILKGEKCYFISYNCEWDFTHIKNWFKRNGRGRRKYFFEPCLCVMSLCACRYDKFMSLHTCATNLNIPVDGAKLHTAEYDNQISIKAYGKLINKLKAA